MKKQLNILKEDKYVCVYTDVENTSKFIFGKIVSVDDEFFTILSFSTSGKSDGIIVKLIDDIIKIEFDGKYSEKMSKLISSSEENVKIADTNNIVYSILYSCLKKKSVVSIELAKSGFEDVIGIPIEITENICKILLLDEYGFSDGYSVFDIKDITQISASSDNEKMLEALWGANQGTISETNQGRDQSGEDQSD